MTSVGLLFVGAALLLNGLVFLGHLEGKDVAVFNVFIGALQLAIPFYVLATASTADEILGVAGVFLFGFTYLYVGIVNLAGLRGVGVGWYSLWVAILTVGFGLVSIVRFDDWATGLLWFQWTALWTLFFATLGLGAERLNRVTGWFTIVAAFTTATVPGFLQLLGVWGDVPGWAIGVSIVATLAVLVPLIPRGGAAGSTRSPTATGGVTPSLP
jgi:hypothetical protein